MTKNSGPELSAQFGRGVSITPLTIEQLQKIARIVAPKNWQFTIRFTGRAEAKRLNREFRKRRYDPNVLTFAYPDTASADIVICTPVVRAQALTQGKTFSAHLTHLVIHGLLHAIGHTHDHDADSQRMESLEKKFLARLGIADPYEDRRLGDRKRRNIGH